MDNANDTHEVVVNIIYKRTPGFKMDTEYLLKTHIPNASRTWASHGMLDCTVTRAPADSAYAYIIAVRFQTMEGWEAATANAEQMGALMADIPNFANSTPDFVVGTVVR